uniref:hypothetical protein n=1 Tax=Lactococcus garvieae TaxID=1363 RepID=UPI00255173E0
SIALSILVEVVEFGISKNHIKQPTNEEKISILQKIGYLWKQGKLKASFSDSLGEYIFAR